MDNDETRPERSYPTSASKMSKTPSWIMLGFVLGAVFVAALPPLRKKPAPEPAAYTAPAVARPAAPREPPQLTTIEAVFDVWGKYAVWTDDVTEVALWSSRENAYADFYEVRRWGDTYYFRTIPRLTRRIIARGKPLPDSPLEFTETEEQYREWQKYGRTERVEDRSVPARPPSFAPTAAPARIDRPVNVVAPTLPPPEIPPVQESGRK